MPTPDWWAISFSVAATPPRVGSAHQPQPGAGACHRPSYGGDQPVQRRRIRQHGGAEGQVFAAGHDGDAVVADRAGEQHGVAGAGLVAGQDKTGGHDADAGGGDEHAVCLAALHHLGIAGHHRHAASRLARPMLAAIRLRSARGIPPQE